MVNNSESVNYSEWSLSEVVAALASNQLVQEARQKLETTRSGYQKQISELLGYYEFTVSKCEQFRGWPELEIWTGGNEIITTQHQMVKNKRGRGILSKKFSENELDCENVFYFIKNGPLITLTGFEDKGVYADLSTFNSEDPWQIDRWKTAQWLIMQFYVYDKTKLLADRGPVSIQRVVNQ